MLKKYASIMFTSAILTIPAGAAKAQCEVWEVKNVVSSITPAEVRFAGEGFAEVSADPDVAQKTLDAAGEALASDKPLLVCFKETGRPVMRDAAVPVVGD